MSIQIEDVKTQTPGVTTYKITGQDAETVQQVAETIPLSGVGQRILERLQKKSG